MDSEKWSQCRHDDARLTESGNARSEQLLVMPTESPTNRECRAAKRALEWIRTSKAWTCYSSQSLHEATTDGSVLSTSIPDDSIIIWSNLQSSWFTFPLS